MTTRSRTTTKDGTIPSRAKASTVRSRPKNDGTDGKPAPKLSKGVVSTARTSVGQKGSAAARKAATVGTRGTPGYQGPAPKLGRSSAVSGTAGSSYGTAAARNHSTAGASGAVSGKEETYGTAPAKNVTKGAYGTWDGK